MQYGTFAIRPELYVRPKLLTFMDGAVSCRDVVRGLGGFCAIPGSHKSYLSLPRERPTSIDLPQVAHVPMSAGDVLIFLAGQVTHGAFKWRQSENRRCVLHNYVPNDRPLNGRNWAQFCEPAAKL